MTKRQKPYRKLWTSPNGELSKPCLHIARGAGVHVNNNYSAN